VPEGLTPALRHEVIERAEWLLRELHVDAYAHLSDVLPLGLEQRLGLLADALKAFIAEPATAQLQAIEGRLIRSRAMPMPIRQARACCG
jgi:hypothetical protein